MAHFTGPVGNRIGRSRPSKDDPLVNLQFFLSLFSLPHFPGILLHCSEKKERWMKRHGKKNAFGQHWRVTQPKTVKKIKTLFDLKIALCICWYWRTVFVPTCSRRKLVRHWNPKWVTHTHTHRNRFSPFSDEFVCYFHSLPGEKTNNQCSVYSLTRSRCMYKQIHSICLKGLLLLVGVFGYCLDTVKCKDKVCLPLSFFHVAICWWNMEDDMSETKLLASVDSLAEFLADFYKEKLIKDIRLDTFI